MSPRYVYVDETKRAGYVLAAVTVPDPVAARQVVRGLILPGQQRLHMHGEQVRRRRAIVTAVISMEIEVVVYDAGRSYRTDREARAACLTGLVEDLAGAGGDVELMIRAGRLARQLRQPTARRSHPLDRSTGDPALRAPTRARGTAACAP